MNSTIDHNLLKKNNKMLIDSNALFPNTLGSQRYVTFNYLNQISNIQLFKTYNIDYV